MKNKLKACAVSYLNTKPFLYGMFRNGLEADVELSLDIPSECARKLQAGEADFGLVPVAIIPHLDNPYIISNYCIGCNGAVRTVCIYSHVPMEEITHLYMDHHSRTSIALADILLNHHWHHNPVRLPAKEGYEQLIQGTRAAVVIGDRTILLHEKFPFCYDLGEVWQQFTGLPFVFAAWVSTKPLEEAFLKKFNHSLQSGIDFIPHLMYLLQSPSPSFSLHEYFTKYISYELDAEKKKGLALFLQYLQPKLPSNVANSLKESYI